MDSTKEEVVEYFIKYFNYNESNKKNIINEDISGDVLLQLKDKLEDCMEILGIKLGTYKKFKAYVEKYLDKFKDKEIKEAITAVSKPKEVKSFFENCLNFKENLNDLDGKGLISLDEQTMKKLGLNLGQRLKLFKYIKYFKNLRIQRNELEINKDSSEEEVAKFLKTRLNISQKSIDVLGLDGETFLELKIEEIDRIDQLTKEEKDNLKKYLRGEYKNEDKRKIESESEIIITKESSEEDVSKFLKKKIGLKEKSIEEFEGIDGETLLSLTDSEIDLLNTLTHKEKDKIKEYINNSKKGKKGIGLNEKNIEEELLNFEKKINLNELKEINIEKIVNIENKEKDILNDYNKNNYISNNNNDNPNNKNFSETENPNIFNYSLIPSIQNQTKNSYDFIEIFFVIGIRQKDYQEYKVFVQTQGVDKECK